LIIIIALVRASRKKNHGEFDYGDSE
jgi:hypothetical protein